MRTLDQPKVFCIAEPQIDTGAMLAYLREVGGEAWYSRVFGMNPDGDGQVPALQRIPAAEALCEFMGRLCYKSWEPGLNKNVTRVREDREEYIFNILRTGHGSVIEHPTFSFVIRGGSRVFTAEMNRHKAGTAISEQSLRFVRLDDIEMWLPLGLAQETLDEGAEVVRAFEEFYTRAVEREFDDVNDDFAKKKILTSKLRRWAPMGLATEEGWSANVRALRHVIEMRTDHFAEEEIRIIVDQIATIMQQKCPLLFGDYEQVPVEGSPAADWTTTMRKV